MEPRTVTPAEDVHLFRDEHLAQLAARGITVADAQGQLRLLRRPPPPIVLDRACTVGDGIRRLDAAAHEPLVARGDDAAAQGRVAKFVPASGAATRMFKDIIALSDSDEPPSASPAGREFFARLDDFPFAEELRQKSRLAGPIASEAEERLLLRTLLETMRYAELPKALIPFHRAERPRTAFEEHLLEATRYVRALDGTTRIHFTVTPDFAHAFESLLAILRPAIEAERPGTSLDVGFSVQDPSTDTLSLGGDGQPFCASDGSLLFRPAGHGALLQNLQALGGDLVVLKNIDNVLPDEVSAQTVRWKRLLIGHLAALQDEVFRHLAASDDAAVSEETLAAALDFACRQFARTPSEKLRSRDDRRRFVHDALNRPLRVCGVVKNDGEPGGAPFWVRAPDGTLSIQIVEASQVNASDETQARIFRTSTHFNPVDIVAGLRRYTGEPFDLSAFVDPATAFVSRKTYEGRPLAALERPGLWNGSMALWNTVCVEVPAATFAPVKTVFDLLRPEHQRSGVDGGSGVVHTEERS
jgi:hypothetical protein